MRFRVIGTDQANRKPVDTIIEAPNLERAGMLARMKRIDYTSIDALDEPVGTAELSDYSKPRKRTPIVIYLVIVVVIVIAAYVALLYLGRTSTP